jgi:hypothetical protein
MSEAFFHEVRVSYSKFVSVGLLTLCSCQPLSQRCLDFIRL